MCVLAKESSDIKMSDANQLSGQKTTTKVAKSKLSKHDKTMRIVVGGAVIAAVAGIVFAISKYKKPQPPPGPPGPPKPTPPGPPPPPPPPSTQTPMASASTGNVTFSWPLPVATLGNKPAVTTSNYTYLGSAT